MSVIKKICTFILVLVLSILFANYFGKIYDSSFAVAHGFSSFIVSSKTEEFLDGLPLAYVLLTTLLYSIFRNPSKYWWMGILLIPAAAFEVYFDWQHIYIPIALGLIGWLLGIGISKLVFSQNR
jgi:chromate transport protein ChrA